MRRQDDATGVPRPMGGVQTGVVLGQIRVSGVSKNAFHKVKVRHQVARGEETNFHTLFRHRAGNFGAD